MTTLITGASGQLANALRVRCPEARLVDSEMLDISDGASVERFDWREVTTIINTAACTNVDECESRRGYDRAFRVNSQGVANLAAEARQRALTLVHFSTDYVFDRTTGPPCGEDEPVHPASAYGASKAAGDLAAQTVARHYVIRTSWLHHPHRRNFVGAMLALAGQRDPVPVVADQLGRPTAARDLAGAVVQLLDAQPVSGIYNVQNDGPVVSWADFARHIFAAASLATSVADISTEEYEASRRAEGRPVAPRPRYSALSLAKVQALGIDMPDWRESLTASIPAFSS